MLHTMDTRKMLLLPFLMCLIVQHGMTKPLDAAARITTLLSENISSSVQEKAEAIDTILQLLAEIDLPAICEAVMMDKPDDVTQMDNIIAAAAKEQGFESMMPTKLQTTENMVLPADFPMKKNDILPADFPMKMKNVMKPVRERAATIVSLDPYSTQTPTSHKSDPTTNVIIQSVESLKPNVSLSAEARRRESKELPKLDRPELVGFKLMPSEHYLKEMEGEKEQAVGVSGGTAKPVESMVEGITFKPSSTLKPESTETTENITSEMNATTSEDSTTTSTTQSSKYTKMTSTTTTATTAQPSTAESSKAKTFSYYSFSSPSTSQAPEIETTTSNEIIEDIAGTSVSNVAALEYVADVENMSEAENTTNEISTDYTPINNTTETVESTTITHTSTAHTTAIHNTTAHTTTAHTTTAHTTTITTDQETSENTTTNTKQNESVSDVRPVNETISLFESAVQEDQTTEPVILSDVENSTQEAVELNMTITTEPSVNTTDLYSDNDSIISTTVEEETTSGSPTTAKTKTTTKTTTKISAAATTEVPTTVTTQVTEAEISNSTPAVTDDKKSAELTQGQSDLDTTVADVSTKDATTLDYFWTPGKTVRMNENMYDYDDTTDDSHTTSFHVSMSSDDVPDVAVDATDDSNVDVNDTDEVTTESIPEVSTESVTAAPGEYDYVYNLVDLNGAHKQETGYHRYDTTDLTDDQKQGPAYHSYDTTDLTSDHKQETTYHRYGSTGSYGGYDVHNDYVPGDVSDYILDPLKPSARFIAGDSKDHKDQGVNMLASVDSPANTAAEQDFMLSAQPGYFNSLADQSSWGYHGDKLKQNSVSDDKDYNKRFTAQSQTPKETATSNLASAAGVRQKTVWSEPTLPQIFFQPNGYACPGLFGYYSDVSDCQAFFICSWGVPYRFLCPPGTLWSSSQTVCDWSSNVNCAKKK